jgi:hypothetical protein
VNEQPAPFAEFPELDDVAEDLRELSVVSVSARMVEEDLWQPIVLFEMPLLGGLPGRATAIVPWSFAPRPTEAAARGALIHMLRGMVDVRRSTIECWPWVEDARDRRRSDVVREAVQEARAARVPPETRVYAAAMRWGLTVRAARRTAGLTQAAFADRYELRVADVSAIERARPHRVRDSVLRRIAEDLELKEPPAVGH